MTSGAERETGLPTVSVVVGRRESASTIAETPESLTRQRRLGWWKVLAVANGSTGGTAVVGRGFEGRLPDLSVLGVPDPGHQARGLNHGVERSRGEVLLSVESDDVVGPDYLLRMARAPAKAPLVGAASEADLLNPPGERAREPRSRSALPESCAREAGSVGTRSVATGRPPFGSFGPAAGSRRTQPDRLRDRGGSIDAALGARDPRRGSR